MNITAALLLSTFMTTSALAGQCYIHEDHPDWTITINDPGVRPEWVWKQGAETVEIETTGAGTGIPVRAALDMDSGEAHRYRFVGDSLLVEMELYLPGCE